MVDLDDKMMFRRIEEMKTQRRAVVTDSEAEMRFLVVSSSGI